MRRLRKAPKAPLAVAAILSTPLFFAALMAMSLAAERPTVSHVLRQGATVVKLGDPAGSTERAIWLLALAPPAGLVAIGVAGMLIGRAGVITSSLTAVAASLSLLLPLNSWTSEHTARYPVGIDLLPPSSKYDIYLRGEWEGTARHTAEQLGIITIVLAGIALAIFALIEVRRRRHAGAPVPPPPPEVITGGPNVAQP